METLLQQKEKVLTKVALRIEKECNFKNGAFITTLILLFIDPKTWTFDKSILARIYQAIDIIERNNELKQLFERKELEENVASDNDSGGSAEADARTSQKTAPTAN